SHGVKPMTLELGGKSPQLVFDDADLDLAARCVAAGIISNAGQACVSGSRLLVHESVAGALVDRIRAAMALLVPGNTWDGGTPFSPIISARQLDRIDGIVQAALAQGAELICGGERFDRPGYFYRPTILAGVGETSPAVTEETFGPVLTAHTIATQDGATALASPPT